VVEWLRDAYLELIERTPLILAELRPAEPYSNGESNPLDWETLARIFYIQTKVTASMKSIRRGSGYCDGCHSDMKFCECRILRLVDETFRGELENLRENLGHVEHPLPRKLPISYLYPLKTILYTQHLRQRSTSHKLEDKIKEA
jgi:hypothetical protein